MSSSLRKSAGRHPAAPAIRKEKHPAIEAEEDQSQRGIYSAQETAREPLCVRQQITGLGAPGPYPKHWEQTAAASVLGALTAHQQWSTIAPCWLIRMRR